MHLTQRDGLSSDHVTCILRHAQGYLWVGTDYGLNRYDGYRFVHYLPDNRRRHRTVSNEKINALAQDAQGDLWIATNDGLNRYCPRTDSFSVWRNTGRNDGSLPNSLVNDILIDRAQQLWLACDNRDLARYDPVGGQFVTYPWKAFLAEVRPDKAAEAYQPIYRLSQKSSGELWLHTKFGLFSFNKTTQKFAYHPTDSGRQAQTYAVGKAQWHLGSDGLTITAQGHRQPLLPGRANNYSAPTGPLTALYREKSNVTWVGGERGLWCYDPLSQYFEHREAGARQGAGTPAWAALPQGKANMPAKASDVIDSRGYRWVIDEDKGLAVRNPATGAWQRPGEAQGFISSSPSSLLADTARRTVWVGSYDYGLFRYDEARDTFLLYRHDEAAPEGSLGGYSVTALCRDARGRIWAATATGGLSCFDYAAQQPFFTITTQDGLPSNQVYGLAADAHGNVWAATPKGLAWVSAQNGRVRAFDRRDGLQTDFLEQAVALREGGEMAVAVSDGYIAFCPDSVLQEPADGGLWITSFKVLDIDMAPRESVVLSWQQNFFSLTFAAVRLSAASRTQCRYRLRGFDQTWRRAEGVPPTATYTNVPPGDYVLEAQAGQPGQWGESSISMRLRISPPFWSTWWFRSLSTLILLAMAWGIYRWRIEQVRSKEVLKATFDQRLARTEMAALRAQMNPHFIFNCLSAVNRFILSQETDEASAYLTKFSRLIRLILENSRCETVPLDRELEALALYIEMEQMRFAEHFEYRLHIAHNVQPEHIELPPLLIQPFVENAIWHGLMHKKSKGMLSIDISYQANRLCIAVEDNGVGRRKATEEDNHKASAKGKSLGMALTAERMALTQQIYGTDASVEVQDLTDSQGCPTGTRILIWMST